METSATHSDTSNSNSEPQSLKLSSSVFYECLLSSAPTGLILKDTGNKRIGVLHNHTFALFHIYTKQSQNNIIYASTINLMTENSLKKKMCINSPNYHYLLLWLHPTSISRANSFKCCSCSLNFSVSVLQLLNKQLQSLSPVVLVVCSSFSSRL